MRTELRAGERGAYLLLLLAVLAGGALYLALRPEPAVPVTLRIHALVGDEPLRLGEGRYENPGGEGTFTIRDFQFFVSKLRLVSDAGEVRDTESYHLARFDGEDGVYRIDLGPIPRRAYQRIELGIGVDSAANNSIEPVGDLDPNGRMAWGWEIGYKFVLVEGGLDLEGDRIPLVYHVGFDENYAEVSIPVEPSALRGESAAIDLCADLLRMFTGADTVDMSRLSNVTFDGDDSRLLAGNYAGMLGRCPDGIPGSRR